MNRSIRPEGWLKEPAKSERTQPKTLSRTESGGILNLDRSSPTGNRDSNSTTTALPRSATQKLSRGFDTWRRSDVEDFFPVTHGTMRKLTPTSLAEAAMRLRREAILIRLDGERRTASTAFATEVVRWKKHEQATRVLVSVSRRSGGWFG
jgi:hypothetical protein